MSVDEAFWMTAVAEYAAAEFDATIELSDFLSIVPPSGTTALSMEFFLDGDILYVVLTDRLRVEIQVDPDETDEIIQACISILESVAQGGVISRFYFRGKQKAERFDAKNSALTVSQSDGFWPTCVMQRRSEAVSPFPSRGERDRPS